MTSNSSKEDNVRDRERAVATPIVAASSRHAALRVPLGSASLQRSPPPGLVPAMQCKSITQVIRPHIKLAIREARCDHRIQQHYKLWLQVSSFTTPNRWSRRR